MNTSRQQNLWVPLLSMVVALAGIISGVLIQYMNIQKETQLKKFEVTFLERRESYVSFVKRFTETMNSVITNAPFDDVITNYYTVEEIYYSMYPFFDEERNSKSIRKEIQEFGMSCERTFVAQKQGTISTDEVGAALNPYKEKIFDLLYQELFAELLP